MRVYVALSPADLGGAVGSGHLPVGRPAHAVTDALRAQELSVDPAATDDDLELAALLDAARSCLGLLDHCARRVVVAADVERTSVVPAAGDEGAAPSSVRLVDAQIPLSCIVSAHADASDATTDVARAVQALADVDGDDAAVEAALEHAEEHDLLWFDATELSVLSAELG